MSRTIFYLKRHDLLPTLRVTPKDGAGATVVIADGATVVFSMGPADSDDVKVNRATAVASGGNLIYTWATGDTDTAGTFWGEFEWSNSGKPETFPNNAVDELVIQITRDRA